MRRGALLTLAALLLASAAFALPAYDNGGSNTATSGSSISVTWTINDGTNGLVTAIVADGNNVAVSGCTCAGNAMTAGPSQTTRANMRTYMYYYLGQAAGSTTVTCTYSSSVTEGTLIVHSYTGVKQTGQPDASTGSNNSTSSTATYTTSITTVANNALIVAGQTVNEDWGSVPAQAPLTSRYSTIGGGSFGTNASSGDYVLATAGSQAVGFTVIGFEAYEQVVASFAPAVAATDTGDFFEAA